MKKTKLTAILASCVMATLGAASVAADRADSYFPFVIEQGAPDSITNVRTWDGANLAVAGSEGFLSAKDGSFVAADGQKRLLGTNLCFSANFCSHEKAERLADSLSRFGIGVVRLHHMDSSQIWGKNMGKGTTEIDPEQLEKLDYLISCLQKRGIYVNINLHVSRGFREIDGFKNADKLPTFDKGVDNFDRAMIVLQKKYAKDLLTHVNPYTGKAYVDDPGVAVIEINNENSVVASWSWGELDNLPEPYAGEFKALWNEWLKKKYKSTAALREAWECKNYPLGDELLDDGVFQEGFDFGKKNRWLLESDATAKQAYRVLKADETGIDSSALRFEVLKGGEVAWRPQFHRIAVELKEKTPYQVSFKARADKETSVGFGVKQHHEPWADLGLDEELKLGKEWKTFTFAFMSKSDDNMARITFCPRGEGDAFEIADLSMREGGNIGLVESETLEDASVPLLRAKKGASRLDSPNAIDDFAAFLHDIENSYWQEMYDYVKSLGAKQLTTGTQLQYGYWYNQAKLDYCDIHAYWNHPNFPHREWDSNDWLIGPKALVNNPVNGTLSSLSVLRVMGKPFTVSEYDHPFPNPYSAEGNVMLAAVAAFQDWDATFQFAWSHNDDFERQTVEPFFDMCSNQTKIAHLPACYGIFVRGDVAKGPGKYVYAPSFSEQEEVDTMSSLLYSYHRDLARGLNLDRSLSLAVYSGLELSDLNLSVPENYKAAKRVESWDDLPAELRSSDKKEIVNEFGEIKWNFQQEGKGTFVVDTARSKVFSGFITKPCEFDSITVDVKDTLLDWATISLVKAKGLQATDAKNGTLSKGSYLLAATGDMKNTDAIVKTVSGSVTTAGAYGGNKGVAPILCEGIDATVTLDNLQADAVEVYSIGANGKRAEKIDVQNVGKNASFSIGANYKTVWYEIVVK